MKDLKTILEKSILANREDIIVEGDNTTCIAEFIEFLVNSKVSEDFNADDVKSVTIFAIDNNILTCKKPGEIVCDYRAYTNSRSQQKDTHSMVSSILFNFIGIDMNTKFLPKSLKKIIYKDLGSDICINLYGDNDLSNVDIDTSDEILRIEAMETNKEIKLGKIECSALYINDCPDKQIYPTGLSLKPGSTMHKLDVSSCLQMENLNGKNLNINNITVSHNVVGGLLRKIGFAGKDTRVWADGIY